MSRRRFLPAVAAARQTGAIWVAFALGAAALVAPLDMPGAGAAVTAPESVLAQSAGPPAACTSESISTAKPGGSGELIERTVTVRGNSTVRLSVHGEAYTSAWSGVPGAGHGYQVVHYVGAWNGAGTQLSDPKSPVGESTQHFYWDTPRHWASWGPTTVYTFPFSTSDATYRFSYRAQLGHSGSDLHATLRIVLASGEHAPECVPPDPRELDTENRAEPNACGAQPHAADPVNVIQGNFWQSWSDVAVPGRGAGLNMARTYSSSRAGSDGPLGFGWDFSYGMRVSVEGAVSRVWQENGAMVPFSTTASGWVPPKRVNATLVEDPGSMSARWVFTRAGREVFRFGADGRLTSISDLSGSTTALTYVGGVLASVTDASGRQLTFTWAAGRITKVTAPAAVLVSGGAAQAMEVIYAYDGVGNLATVTGTDGGVWTFGYDGAHRVMTVREPRHHSLGAGAPVVANHYDAQGRVVRQDDRLGRRTTFGYGVGATTVTDPGGRVTVFEHTDGICTGIIRDPGPGQSRWSFVVDRFTLGRTRVTDPNGVVTSASFNDRGLPTSVTTPKGTTTVAYAPVTMVPTAVTDPSGVTTTYTYAAGSDRLTGVSRPVTPGTGTWTMTLGYNDVNNPGAPSEIVDARGKRSTFAYNVNGDVVSASVPTGASSAPLVTTWVYNSHGWPLSSVAPAGSAPGGVAAEHTTAWGYNRAGDVVRVTDALGAVTEFGVDLSGYRLWVRDPVPLGEPVEQTNLGWNAAGELTTVTRPGGSSLLTEYWPDGSVKSQVDGAGAATGYGYDSQGRLSTVTDPAGRVTTFRYDPGGRVVSEQQPGGSCLAAAKVACITYSYFPSGELEKVDYSDPATSDVTFGYDALGRRTSMVDTGGISSFEWDSIGRLRSSADPVAGTVSYGYGDNGPRATTVTYPGGKTVSRTFDDAGRQSSLTGWVGGTTGFGYDPNSNLVASDTAATVGVEHAQRFDRANRVTGSTLRKATTDLATLAYTRDPEGMVRTTSATGIAGPADSYGYNGFDLLTSDSTGAFSYDPADNLTGFPDGRRQRFDLANQLCYQAASNTAPCGTPPAGATTYTYDDRGNRVTTASGNAMPIRYGYDQADRLVSVSDRRDGAYNPIVPSRLLDTRAESRTGLCPTATSQCTTIGHTQTRTVQIGGQGGVPSSGVAGVFMTLSVLNTQSAGDLTVAAADVGSGFGATTIAYGAGDWASTTVFVRLPADGRITINAPWGGTDVIVDVQGWVSSSSGTGTAVFTPLDSQRIMSTRSWEQSGACPTSPSQCARIPAGGTLTVQVAGHGGVPATGATAVALNVIATGSRQAGQLQVRDASQPPGVDATILYGAGQTDANGHIVKLSSDGKIKIHSTAEVDVLVNVQGWFGATSGGSTFSPHNATRLLDTRADTRTGSCPTASTECTTMPAGSTRTVQVTGRAGVPAAGVTAVAFNLIVLPSASGTLSVGRADAPPTGDGEIHYIAGQGLTTNVIVPVSPDGRIRLDAVWGGTEVLLDVQGWFSTSSPSYTYTYAGDGLRRTKTGPDGTVTTFTWDRAGPLPLLVAEAIDAPGQANDRTIRYLYDPTGRVLADITTPATGADTIRWYHHDQLGSTRALTNATGDLIGSFTYSPYGQPTGSTGTATTPMGWAGEYRDHETGFIYLRARYYDPTTAQFLTRDPLEAITRSPYAYAGNNPINYTDPTGLCPMCLVFLGGAAIGGGLDLGFQVLGNVANGCGALSDIDWRRAGISALAGGVTNVGGSWLVGLRSAPQTAMRLPVSETWGNPRTLARHFRDHGADFGARSADDYARMSSEFFQRSQLQRLPTKIDADGVIRVYDPASNAFGAYNPTGTTRTFFTPKRGIDYWNDQPGTAPWGPG